MKSLSRQISGSINAVADHLFCTPTRVREMIREGIFPADVVLDLDECRRLALEWLRGRAGGKAPKTRELEDTRTEALRLDIERKRLELAELQGLLVRLTTCQEEWEATCITIRAKLLAAPSKAAAAVAADVAPAVQAQVRAVVIEVLREIAHEVKDGAPAGTVAGSRAGGRAKPRARGDSKRARKR